jgi:hypothetical protein
VRWYLAAWVWAAISLFGCTFALDGSERNTARLYGIVIVLVCLLGRLFLAISRREQSRTAKYYIGAMVCARLIWEAFEMIAWRR